MSSWDNDDVPQLSVEASKALEEFYKEQEERQARLKIADKSQVLDIENIEENWQLSQFWYDEVTITTLVDVVLKSVEPQGKIALISCPSLYKKLREKSDKQTEITLFEYDNRFAVYGSDFVLYDYNEPEDLPQDKLDYYDLVVADPPFLSEDCLSKVMTSIKRLTRKKVILCTGATMTRLALQHLNLRKSGFVPKHRNNLANEFCCFANFNLDEVL